MTEHKIARGQASAIAAMRHLSAGRLGLAALGVAVLLTIFSARVMTPTKWPDSLMAEEMRSAPAASVALKVSMS